MPTTNVKQVPLSALRFNIGEFALGDNGQGAKSAPIKMVARTGKPINHWFWGKVAHDLAGMTLHKDRLPIDYCHDPQEVMGYLNKFDATSGDLVASGALVPYKDSDRATEVIAKSKAGVPYEASISFGGGETVIEEIGPRETAQVNGHEFTGPGIVIRKWALRGVAVCPYGADMNTSSQFAQQGDQTQPVTYMTKELIMPEQQKPAEAAPVAVVEALQTQTPAAVVSDPPAPATELAQAPVAPAPAEAALVAAVEAPVAQVNPGQKFLDEFGDQGGVWFAQGKSLDESRGLFVKHLQEQFASKDAEIADLKNRLAAVSRGDKPVAFSPAADLTPAEQAKAKVKEELTPTLGANLAGFAAGITLPGKKS